MTKQKNELRFNELTKILFEPALRLRSIKTEEAENIIRRGEQFRDGAQRELLNTITKILNHHKINPGEVDTFSYIREDGEVVGIKWNQHRPNGSK